MNELESLVDAWLDKKESLKRIKAEETELRNKIVEITGSGTTHLDGFKVVVTVPTYFKVDPELLSILDLTPDERDAIRWKPELNVSKYKKIAGGLLDVAVSTKQGMPQVKIVEEILG